MREFIDADDSQNENQVLNEYGGFITFAQYLVGLGLPMWQTMLIYIGVVFGSFFGLLAIVNSGTIISLAKRAYRDYKDKKQITPEVLDKLQSELDEIYPTLKPGQKAWISGLSKRLKDANTSGKDLQLSVKREIESYLKRVKNPKDQ